MNSSRPTRCTASVILGERSPSDAQKRKRKTRCLRVVHLTLAQQALPGTVGDAGAPEPRPPPLTVPFQLTGAAQRLGDGFLRSGPHPAPSPPLPRLPRLARMIVLTQQLNSHFRTRPGGRLRLANLEPGLMFYKKRRLWDLFGFLKSKPF